MSNKKYARELRKNQTPAEKLIWQHLRNRNLNNHKYRRQHSIGNYIVDFCCLQKKLIIELDGGHHNETEHQLKDDIRTEYLKSEGFEVLRFWNNQIINETDEVLNFILDRLEPPSPQPSP